ncbi:tRNA (adenosine(37)-N6)-dimethylallyltransferase MiaA [Marinoscillum furvescens]|uniref:tRNA dimethylallyltransferase n=1 Tax=Marinoscillum furvescens DSM 4134 TaxID=1122208 RepID=A0A3D9L2H0_MARFU|nr:tRNA (adenosine(37)-N6)-dimethylallyltransferase MiaA [Marinoscillum furvescens]RED96635.1 tRNA dimethylallyltransferase [Marinoscillum furvescens DSM 4134]
MSAKTKILLSVVGPTAVGKTAFAIQLAQHFKTEIISADSRQFYREMEIGTAKPDADELAAARHHFINSHAIQEHYSVGMYERDALLLLDRLFQKYDVVIAVGGSGLFFKALWEGLDDMPEVDLNVRAQLNATFQKEGLDPLLKELEAEDPIYYDQVDRHNHQRVIRALEVIRSSGKPFSAFRKGEDADKPKRPFTNVKVGLTMDREVLFDRINQRMDQMIAQGLFKEAMDLMPYKDHNALQTVGYTEIFRYLEGAYDKEEAIRLLKRNSRRYAKRQMTWFRRDEEIKWVKPDDFQEVIRSVSELLDA